LIRTLCLLCAEFLSEILPIGSSAKITNVIGSGAQTLFALHCILPLKGAWNLKQMKMEGNLD